jgi:hypothetical protein
MHSTNNRSIPDLVSDALGQLAKLVSNEFELARAEMTEKAVTAGRAAALIAAGAVFFIPALVMVLFAIAAALMHAGLSDPVAYLITGVGAAAVGAALVWSGLSRFSGGALKPKVTLEQIERDKMAAREMVR